MSPSLAVADLARPLWPLAILVGIWFVALVVCSLGVGIEWFTAWRQRREIESAVRELLGP